MFKETFVAETIDGWKLQIFRTSIHKNAQPILLWHGLSTCSEIFQSHSFSNSQGLQEFLTRKGFDVFVGNSRGNKFTKNDTLIDDWEFSLDEGLSRTYQGYWMFKLLLIKYCKLLERDLWFILDFHKVICLLSRI
jgi:hypothetical protein